ncbi:MAG: endonuclease dU [Thermoproteota archaeon]
MIGIRTSKKAIRALGVAESFKRGSSKAFLAGVVMRSDFIIDGFSSSHTTVAGDDATISIISLYNSLGREDVNLIMIGGTIISMYNIVDVNEVFEETGRPVLAVTYRSTKGIEEAIKKHFPDSWEKKLGAYRKLGPRSEIALKTGFKVFIRSAGIDDFDSRLILNKFTVFGRVPEPIRVARLLARSLSSRIEKICVKNE